MYLATGNDDVFALDARTGALIWEHRSGIDQNINTVCCGWDNRGVAVGDGKVFIGQLDGTFVALDAKTGKQVWQTQVGKWQDGYTITAAPLYYNGVVYTGISGGDRTARGFLAALDAKTGQEKWRFWTVPAPGRVRLRHLAEAGRSRSRQRAKAWTAGRRRDLADAGDRSGTRAASTSRPAIPARKPAAWAPTGRATICSVRRSWR